MAIFVLLSSYSHIHFYSDSFSQTAVLDYARTMNSISIMDIFAATYFREFFLAKIAKINCLQKYIGLQYIDVEVNEEYFDSLFGY